DCTITGQVCPTAGASCFCSGGGEKVCPASNSCIPNTTCCTSSDCTVLGQTCSAPGGTCGCASGQRVCSASNSCIPNANCCTTADCTTPPDACHVLAGATCSGGACGYPPLACPYTGQTCAGGICSCPSGQRPCGANGACISN